MESIFTNEEWGWLPSAIVYLLNTIVILFLGKVFFQWFHKKLDIQKELVKEDNFAFALASVGYYVGLIIAVSAAIIGESYGIGWDVLNMLSYGILAALLLNIASVINDKIILNTFSIRKEILRDHNSGTGVIEAANFIASGLIINGAMTGQMSNLFPEMPYGWLTSGIMSVVIFWLIGQVLLIVLTKVYTKILPYDVHEEIEEDNVAAGISFAGVVVAIGVLISYGISGDFQGWGDHFMKIGIEVLVGILILPLIRLIVDAVLLPGEKLTDEIIRQEHPNKGAALIEAFAYIGGAFLITICI